MKTQSARPSNVAITLGLCFAVALLEGVDLQSIGVAGTRMAHEFGMSVNQMGVLFSAGTLGLLPGAIFGGRLADRIGRRPVLILSTVVFGLLSVATSFASGFEAFMLARVLTGVGLGGALPNLIAFAAESVSPRARNTAVSFVYCGIPLGGVAAALVGVLSGGDSGWRQIFYFGGALPLLLAPFLWKFLRESTAFGNAARHGVATSIPMREVLFGGQRRYATLLLWGSYFATLIVLYFLLNWLPSLMAARGLGRAEAGFVQISFNVGSGIGVLCIGILMDRLRAGTVLSAVYLGVVISLAALAVSPVAHALTMSAFFAGMFVTGGQSILYALSAAYYPTAMRGTGVGAAVAVGRIGSIVGPLAAAHLLSMGHSSSTVIGASIPVILIAAAAALLLLTQPRAEEPAGQ